MKKLLILAVLAIAAGTSPAEASNATVKSTFEVIAQEGMSGSGQVVETRAKKGAPWYSISMTLSGVKVADENGPVEYCLHSFADVITEVDRSFANAETGILKVDYGTRSFPSIIVVTRCDDPSWLALGSGFVAPRA